MRSIGRVPDGEDGRHLGSETQLMFARRGQLCRIELQTFSDERGDLRPEVDGMFGKGLPVGFRRFGRHDSPSGSFDLREAAWQIDWLDGGSGRVQLLGGRFDRLLHAVVGPSHEVFIDESQPWSMSALGENPFDSGIVRPCIIASSMVASAMQCAKGPGVSRLGANGTMPAVGTLPQVGLQPTNPQ